MERRHELIPISYVRIWASRFLVEGRDLLLGAPGELADILAAESDPLKVSAHLQRWVDRTIQRYFNWRPCGAAASRSTTKYCANVSTGPSCPWCTIRNREDE